MPGALIGKKIEQYIRARPGHTVISEAQTRPEPFTPTTDHTNSNVIRVACIHNHMHFQCLGKSSISRGEWWVVSHTACKSLAKWWGCSLEPHTSIWKGGRSIPPWNVWGAHSPWNYIYLRDLAYEERLNECGLTTLETRRLRGDQIEVFKILNGYENIDYNIFFEIKESKITRGHNYTLVKKTK